MDFEAMDEPDIGKLTGDVFRRRVCDPELAHELANRFDAWFDGARGDAHFFAAYLVRYLFEGLTWGEYNHRYEQDEVDVTLLIDCVSSVLPLAFVRFSERELAGLGRAEDSGS